MTYEELISFRDSVAAPAMQRILDNTKLVDGLCFIDKLSLSYIDGRSWGVDSVFKASGLIYEGGKVKPFEHVLEDEEFCDFLQKLEGCSFIYDGDVEIKHEFMELELKTSIRAVCGLEPLFEDVKFLRPLSFCDKTPEYLKMCQLYHQEQKGLDAVLDEAKSKSEKQSNDEEFHKNIFDYELD